ncbi:MAG: gamma-glutamylcyclotransferase [Pseudomonadota bacterium]
MIEVFGYGSLVNRRTQNFGGTPAKLSGWQRIWVTTPVRAAAFLSVKESAGEIDGLFFPVPDDDLPDLDRREAQYERQPLGAGQVIYSVPAANQTTRRCPILRSYLDTVLQGFLHEFGKDGIGRFITTTQGWEAGLLDDRAAPLYPRAQQINAEEQRLFAACLASVPVVEKL